MIFGLLPLTLASTTLAQLTVTVYNHCPTIIKVNNRTAPLATLPPEQKYSVDVTEVFVNTFVNADEDKPLRAAIFDDGYYYMVADGRFANTGIRMTPSVTSDNGGYCEIIECDSIGCDQAFPSVEGFPLTVPLLEVPQRPLYQCPTADNFDITFCPSGQFPDVVITFGGNMCLHFEGATVKLAACDNSAAQNWLINAGSTAVRASGTNLCLEASPNPHDGQTISVSPCNDLPGQQWFYTDDKHITLRDQGFCLNVRDGDTTKGDVQMWTCVGSNTNQIWTRSAPGTLEFLGSPSKPRQ